ncbi:hypothetical protein POM88_027186 [Heracleum sosnowskyi]|uniref:Uncharacterized protein n=1 Tax=Heracleum sosnowskyi TaxID=360622 RepID=A0AAD8I9I5_9APIA|nr:hypothetical protein POM88_027186 [Heracleum sosnowskyi]
MYDSLYPVLLTGKMQDSFLASFALGHRSLRHQVFSFTKGIDGTALTAIVTGATNGIGKETTRVLALRHVHVVMGVRNVITGEKIREELLQKPDITKGCRNNTKVFHWFPIIISATAALLWEGQHMDYLSFVTYCTLVSLHGASRLTFSHINIPRSLLSNLDSLSRKDLLN